MTGPYFATRGGMLQFREDRTSVEKFNPRTGLIDPTLLLQSYGFLSGEIKKFHRLRVEDRVKFIKDKTRCGPLYTLAHPPRNSPLKSINRNQAAELTLGPTAKVTGADIEAWKQQTKVFYSEKIGDDTYVRKLLEKKARLNDRGPALLEAELRGPLLTFTTPARDYTGFDFEALGFTYPKFNSKTPLSREERQKNLKQVLRINIFAVCASAEAQDAKLPFILNRPADFLRELTDSQKEEVKDDIKYAFNECLKDPSLAAEVNKYISEFIMVGGDFWNKSRAEKVDFDSKVTAPIHQADADIMDIARILHQRTGLRCPVPIMGNPQGVIGNGALTIESPAFDEMLARRTGGTIGLTASINHNEGLSKSFNMIHASASPSPAPAVPTAISMPPFRRAVSPDPLPSVILPEPTRSSVILTRPKKTNLKQKVNHSKTQSPEQEDPTKDRKLEIITLSGEDNPETLTNLQPRKLETKSITAQGIIPKNGQFEKSGGHTSFSLTPGRVRKDEANKPDKLTIMQKDFNATHSYKKYERDLYKKAEFLRTVFDGVNFNNLDLSWASFRGCEFKGKVDMSKVPVDALKTISFAHCKGLKNIELPTGFDFDKKEMDKTAFTPGKAPNPVVAKPVANKVAGSIRSGGRGDDGK